MEAEDYITQYGHSLTEAEKRYIRAFGAPQVHTGPSRNPYTAGLRIGNAPSGGALDQARHRVHKQR